uniref:Uncharacterized protein n=1 Tax=Arundo donax TaxID=35708 RepID=A0A0A9T933_ARUDO
MISWVWRTAVRGNGRWSGYSIGVMSCSVFFSCLLFSMNKHFVGTKVWCLQC